MTPGKLLSEIQVGGGSNGKYGLDRRAYGSHGDIDPNYWYKRLIPEDYASGTIIRYGWGVLNTDDRVYSIRHYSDKHDGYFANPFDMPVRILHEQGLGTAWGQAMFEEAHRAALNDIPVYWYHGKPGIGLYDSLALDIINALPGTHIVDATNGADGRPYWMPRDWWGEAFPLVSGRQHGAYCFARNLCPRLVPDDQPNAETINAERTEQASRRVKYAVYDAKIGDKGRIISCHEDADFEWLLGTTVTKLVNGPADMPTWEILLKSGISLAFRGDEDKVDADLGGRLSEMKEVAG